MFHPDGKSHMKLRLPGAAWCASLLLIPETQVSYKNQHHNPSGLSRLVANDSRTPLVVLDFLCPGVPLVVTGPRCPLSPSLSLEESLGPIPSSVFPSEKQPCACEEYTRPSSPFSDLECDGIVTSRYQSSDFNSGYAKTGPISSVSLKRRRGDSGETHQPCYAATRDRLGLEKRRETKLDTQLSQAHRHLLHSFVFVQTPTTLLSVVTWTARAEARRETAPLISLHQKRGRGIELYLRRGGRRRSRAKKPEERNKQG